jgi:hypothetical protein
MTEVLMTLAALTAYCRAQDVLYEAGEQSFSTGQTNVYTAIYNWLHPQS